MCRKLGGQGENSLEQSDPTISRIRAMETLLGTYDYTIDDQGRVNIPASFRRDLSEQAKKAFIVVRSPRDESENFLILYPAEVWDRVASDMRQQAEGRKQLRRMLLDGAQLEMDGQGRINIPQKLREFAGLEREVVIQGMLDHAELWDRERFKRSIRDDPG